MIRYPPVPKQGDGMRRAQILKEEVVFPYTKWLPQINDLGNTFRHAHPFPHIVLDDFLQPEVLKAALKEFPALNSGEWTQYLHANERKFGKTDVDSFPSTLQAIINELNSPCFIQFLTDLSGIKNLLPDPSLEGGGLHQSGPGGHLNIHADFTVHPLRRHWRRRLNVLVYLNENWQEAYGGHLELWDRKMKHRVHRIAPVFNRAVIFNTRANSFHGHPEPLKCPPSMTRKSIALYYFTEQTDPFIKSTEYRARPGEGLRSVWIYLDKMILRGYDAVKRRFNFSDRFASSVLGALDRVRRFLRGKK